MARARRTGEGLLRSETHPPLSGSSSASSPVQQMHGLQNALGNQNILQLLSAGQRRETGRLEAEAERAANTGRASGPIAKLSPGATGENASLPESSGTQLSAGLKRPMEARLGADLSHVKVHTGAGPAEMNRQLNSRAFTYGQNIYFGAGEYQPETAKGSHLLAHELAHTVQQSSGTKTIQKKDKDDASSEPVITAQGIFGMPQGSKVVINRTMKDSIFDLIKSHAAGLKDSKDPDDVARAKAEEEFLTALNALDTQTGTVTTANDTLVEIKLDKTVTIKALGSESSLAFKEVTLQLLRTAPGVFDFIVSGTPATPNTPPLTMKREGLAATKVGGKFVLSKKGEPDLEFTPASGTPLMTKLEGTQGITVDVASVTQVPEAAPEKQEKIVKQIIEDAGKQKTKGSQHQSVMLGGGFVHGARFDPMLTTSWTYRFRVSPKLANFVQVPLEAEVMYAPSASFLGTLSSGGYASLADLKIPVNIRFISGFGGGRIAGPTPAGGGPRPELGVLGPTLGAGLGLEAGWFRFDLRYEHLFNVLQNRGPNLDFGSLRVGAAF